MRKIDISTAAWQEILNETKRGANTHVRVGNAGLAIIEAIIEAVNSEATARQNAISSEATARNTAITSQINKLILDLSRYSDFVYVKYWLDEQGMDANGSSDMTEYGVEGDFWYNDGATVTYEGHKLYRKDENDSWLLVTSKKLVCDSSGRIFLWDGQTMNCWVVDQITAARTALKNELLGGAGAAFDTLKELQTALGNDANFSTTVLTKIAEKLAGSAVLETSGDTMQNTIQGHLANVKECAFVLYDWDDGGRPVGMPNPAGTIEGYLRYNCLAFGNNAGGQTILLNATNGDIYTYNLAANTVKKLVFAREGKGLSTNDLTDELLALFNTVTERAYFTQFNRANEPLDPMTVINAIMLGGDMRYASINLATAAIDMLDCSGTKFNYALIDSSNFNSCNFSYCDFDQSTISGVIFDGCQLTGANFNHALISGSKFIGCGMSAGSFYQSKLDLVDFTGSTFSSPNQSDINIMLSGANCNLGATVTWIDGVVYTYDGSSWYSVGGSSYASKPINEYIASAVIPNNGAEILVEFTEALNAGMASTLIYVNEDNGTPSSLNMKPTANANIWRIAGQDYPTAIFYVGTVYKLFIPNLVLANGTILTQNQDPSLFYLINNTSTEPR